MHVVVFEPEFQPPVYVEGADFGLAADAAPVVGPEGVEDGDGGLTLEAEVGEELFAGVAAGVSGGGPGFFVERYEFRFVFDKHAFEAEAEDHEFVVAEVGEDGAGGPFAFGGGVELVVGGGGDGFVEAVGDGGELGDEFGGVSGPG